MCIRDRSNADINAEIKQTNKEIKESNKELTAKVVEIGESNKQLTARVADIAEKVNTVDTKINERVKVFETTMQKSFIEQVTLSLIHIYITAPNINYLGLYVARILKACLNKL